MKFQEMVEAGIPRSKIEEWCRAHTQVAYLGDYTALCRVLGECLVYVDTRDRSIAPHLMMSGFWEMWVSQAIASYLKPGMRSVDAGANFGYYSLLMGSIVGSTGEVIGFEPWARTFDLLERTMQLSGIQSTMIHAPLAAKRECVPLYFAENEFGSPTIVSREDDPCLVNTRNEVETMTMDSAVAGRIDFVKIDVQGAELQVLQGMTRIIRENPQIQVALEFTPTEHPDPLAALTGLRDAGWNIRTIGTDGEIHTIALEKAATVDTGDHRMLWLSRQ